MSEVKTNGLSIVAQNGIHIAFNADVAFTVEKRDDVPSVHISDVVYSIVLDALKKQADGAKLVPGNYRLAVTGFATDVGVENVQETIEETDEEAAQVETSEDVQEEPAQEEEAPKEEEV